MHRAYAVLSKGVIGRLVSDKVYYEVESVKPSHRCNAPANTRELALLPRRVLVLVNRRNVNNANT